MQRRMRHRVPLPLVVGSQVAGWMQAVDGSAPGLRGPSRAECWPVLASGTASARASGLGSTHTHRLFVAFRAWRCNAATGTFSGGGHAGMAPMQASSTGLRDDDRKN